MLTGAQRLLTSLSNIRYWVELVLISVLFPNVSFLGHLSGIVAGQYESYAAYCKYARRSNTAKVPHVNDAAGC